MIYAESYGNRENGGQTACVLFGLAVYYTYPVREAAGGIMGGC